MTIKKAAATAEKKNVAEPVKRPPRPSIADMARQNLLNSAQQHANAIEGLPTDTQAWNARDISVDLIDPSPFQPRKEFDHEYIEGLARAIDEHGLITPVEVRPKEGNRYELVCGECRLMAHKLLKKSFIKCHVANISDEDSSARALAENLNRKNLTDFETFLAITNHRSKFGNATQNHEVLGLGRTEYFRLMSFDILPEAVLVLLESRPGLVSGYSVEALKTYISPLLKENKVEQSAVDKTVKSVIQTAIDSSVSRIKNLAAEVETILFPKSFRAKPKPITHGESIIGDMIRKGNFLHVKVAAEKLTEEKIGKLEAFLISLYASE